MALSRVYLLFIVFLFSNFSSEASSKSKRPEAGKLFKTYSLKNLAKAKSAKAKRLRAALEEGGVMIEYSYSKKKVSGDKHMLMDLKAVVMKKVSDNFIKEPLAHFIPSGKAGAKVCRIEGHDGYFRTQTDFHQREKLSTVAMMSDRFTQRILVKDIEKHRVKNSKIDPNDESQILVSTLAVSSAKLFCTD